MLLLMDIHCTGLSRDTNLMCGNFLLLGGYQCGCSGLGSEMSSV